MNRHKFVRLVSVTAKESESTVITQNFRRKTMLNMRRSNLLFVSIFALAVFLLLGVPFGNASWVFAQYSYSTTVGPSYGPAPVSTGPISLPITIPWPDPTQNATVKLSVSQGTLTVNPSLASTMSQQIAALSNNYSADEARINAAAPLAAASVSGNGSSSLTVTGTGSDINVILSSVVYQPGNFIGVAQLVITANSPGYSSTSVTPISTVANSPIQASGIGSTANTGTLFNGPVSLAVAPNTVTNGSVASVIMAQNGLLLVPAGQFGNIALIKQGIITAVDVFGITPGGKGVLAFNSPVKVCLQGVGHLYFLDATTSPRAARLLAGTVSNGATCATINNSGTLVLTAH